LCHLASDVSLGLFETRQLVIQCLHTLFGVLLARGALTFQGHHICSQGLQIVLPYAANDTAKKKYTA
jgi:hypothetical protein